jgi:hypothetical protein
MPLLSPHAFTEYIRTSYFFSLFYPCLGLPSAFYPFGFPTRNLYELLLFPVPDTFPSITIIAHLDFINWIKFNEEYKSWINMQLSPEYSFLFFMGTISSLAPYFLTPSGYRYKITNKCVKEVVGYSWLHPLTTDRTGWIVIHIHPQQRYCLSSFWGKYDPLMMALTCWNMLRWI